MLHLQHTLGRGIHGIMSFMPKEVKILVPAIADDLRDEAHLVCKELIQGDSSALSNDGWREVNLCRFCIDVVSMIACRAIVGKAASRDRDFVRQVVILTHLLTVLSIILDIFPAFMRGIIVHLSTFHRRRHKLNGFLHGSSRRLRDERSSGNPVSPISCGSNALVN
jgi:hypothetical protein